MTRITKTHSAPTIWPGLFSPALIIFLIAACLLNSPVYIFAAGATTTLHIVKYNPDGKTVKAEKTVDYQWMMKNLPVQGDGVTHYYHQGPVFEGDAWDPVETINLKDKGAVKGTAVKDLCDLVGGMEEGGEVVLKAVDGFALTLAYNNIYHPVDIQGPVTLCWYKSQDVVNAESADFGYPADDGYNSALQILVLAQTANAVGQHVFGNQDMKVCMPEEKYRHFYNGFPSTNGLSVKWVSEIRIYSQSAPPQPTDGPVPYSTDHNNIPWRPLGLGIAGVILIAAGGLMLIRKQ